MMHLFNHMLAIRQTNRQTGNIPKIHSENTVSLAVHAPQNQSRLDRLTPHPISFKICLATKEELLGVDGELT